MKQIEVSSLARRYAIAFLNLFFEKLPHDCLEKLNRFKKFLQENRMFYVCLRLPTLSFLKKQKILNKTIKSFNLSTPVQKLVLLLLDHGRIEMLAKVVEKIIIFYRQRKNTELFGITTSHKLSDSEKKRVIKFVKILSSGDVVTNFEVDEKLIAGFRIQSKTFLWERSIAKQLRDIKRSIFKQVGIW